MINAPKNRLRESLSIIKHILLYQISPLGLASRKQLKELRNSQHGKRCFIIGNGPSIQQTDLSKLRAEITFGLNRIYLLFPKLGFSTTYLVMVNWLVLEQCINEILPLSMIKFLPWTFRKRLDPKMLGNMIFVQDELREKAFTTDARRPMWQGATVTFVALQLAYHLGFKQVILVGVDHSFRTPGKAHSEVVSQGDDPNHFSPDYFGNGFRWNLPDLETSEIAYHLAKRAFEADGRMVLDATIGGKLTVFPKVNYRELFD
jgi:hypothetical protein